MSSVAQMFRSESVGSPQKLYKISIMQKQKKKRTLLNTEDNSKILRASQLWQKHIQQQQVNNTGILHNNLDSDPRNSDSLKSLKNSKIIFQYIIFRGVYRLQISLCDDSSNDNSYNSNNDNDDKR